MTHQLLNQTEAREAFHVLLLRRLVDALPRGTWRVKGGVNLRLFFGSARYSEDMDLDVDLHAREAIRKELSKAIRDPQMLARLRTFGIREVLRGEREIHKDTETTLRFKARLVAQGDIPLPTKVEASFRAGRADDVVLEEPANLAIVGRYLDPTRLPLVVPHYSRSSAVRQKFAALALRTQVQARDVFDLFALTGGTVDGLDLDLLRKNLPDPELRQARDRAMELPVDAYKGNVLEYLGEADRAAWADRWDEQRLFVAQLAELLLARPGGAP